MNSLDLYQEMYNKFILCPLRPIERRSSKSNPIKIVIFNRKEKRIDIDRNYNPRVKLSLRLRSRIRSPV